MLPAKIHIDALSILKAINGLGKTFCDKLLNAFHMGHTVFEVYGFDGLLLAIEVD